MLILGIETSCDDTSASVIRVEDGIKILSNIVSSQAEIHKRYGGIVPELAARRHIELIWPVVDEALLRAGISLDHIDLISVCHGPGLIGSLIVGCSFAKAISFVRNIRLIGVNHLEGHLFSVLPVENLDFPFLGLIVSGGHTSLVRVDGPLRYREIGKTRDDAVGEAYDKVAKLLGLGYPGGPIIDRLAGQGRADAIPFTRPYLPEGLDFSFSGLKTAVLNLVKSLPEERLREMIPDICASFQATVMDVLEKKVEWALRREGLKRVVISGGVAANSELRRRFHALAERLQITLHIPPPKLCTDNAAMIAAAGYLRYISGRLSDLRLNPRAYIPIEEENLP